MMTEKLGLQYGAGHHSHQVDHDHSPGDEGLILQQFGQRPGEQSRAGAKEGTASTAATRMAQAKA